MGRITTAHHGPTERAGSYVTARYANDQGEIVTYRAAYDYAASDPQGDAAGVLSAMVGQWVDPLYAMASRGGRRYNTIGARP